MNSKPSNSVLEEVCWAATIILTSTKTPRWCATSPGRTFITYLPRQSFTCVAARVELTLASQSIGLDGFSGRKPPFKALEAGSNRLLADNLRRLTTSARTKFVRMPSNVEPLPRNRTRRSRMSKRAATTLPTFMPTQLLIRA